MLSRIQTIIEIILLGFSRSLEGLRKEPGIPTVNIEVAKMKHVRTLREIFIAYELAKYKVEFQATLNRWTLSVLRILEWHPKVVVGWQKRSSQTRQFIVTDDIKRWEEIEKKDAALKKVLLHYDYRPGLDLPAGHYTMPIPMHSQIYCQYQDHMRLDQYRSSQRNVRMFFAGNWNASYREVMKTKYGLLSRDEVIDYLRSKNSSRLISSDNELHNLLQNGYLDELVLLDKTIRINQQYWMGVLGKVDFFLCLPGIPIPWSHNAVEAMAVGTIPLINYPDWFYPSLVDGENCIRFETLEELDTRVEQILDMSTETIDRLRKNVCAYYDQYLAPTTLVENMLADRSDRLHLHIWDVA
jgi:hypothetical protein